MTVLVSAVAVDAGLVLGWGDGGKSFFPWSWLRDACPCDECRAEGGRQRTLDVASIDFPVGTPGVDWTGETLRLTWPDHASIWPASELQSAAPPPERTVGAGLHQEAWSDVKTSDAALERLLGAVVDRGAALLTGVPTEPAAVLDVVAAFGYVRPTNYGALFDVRPVIDPTNLADTAVGLGPHTDNPYRDPVPSIQVLHCLRSTATGGDTVLVDGFEAVARLDVTDPAAAQRLRTTMWRWCWQDAGNYLEATGPVIDAAPDGSLRQVRFNERSRAPAIGLPADPAPALAALAAFTRVLADPSGWTKRHLAPGDAVIMDNRRILHARTAFEAAGERWLQGCYSDMDGLRSRLAVLRRKETARDG